MPCCFSKVARIASFVLPYASTGTSTVDSSFNLLACRRFCKSCTSSMAAGCLGSTALAVIIVGGFVDDGLAKLGKSSADIGRPSNVDNSCRSLLTCAMSCSPCAISAGLNVGFPFCSFLFASSDNGLKSLAAFVFFAVRFMASCMILFAYCGSFVVLDDSVTAISRC